MRVNIPRGLSILVTLLHQIDTHCSTHSARSVENSLVSQALKVNGYPQDFGSSSTCKEDTSINTGMEVNSCISYLGVSESLKRVLVPLGVIVCFCPANIMLSRPKDVIPDMQKLGVVYKIPCASCPASYIGQTGHRLRQRLDEHKRAIRQRCSGF